MTPAKTPTKLTFAQGLMLFFVQRIFDEHIVSTFFGDDNTNKFIIQWSKIVREGLKKDPNFPCRIKVPEDFGKKQIEPASETEAILTVQGKQIRKRIKKGGLDLSFIKDEKYRDAYRPLFEEPQFFPLISLLADDDLGQLMQIEYSAGLAELATITAPAPKAEGKDAEIVREAAARSLGKKPEELTKEDIEENVKKLDLSARQIEEVDSISEFKGLTSLDLSGTQVSNIETLKGLSNLQWLDLSGTQVSNIEPLGGLSNLQWLYLSVTQVSDLTPIKELTNLQRLSLSGTQVSNIEPLGGLSNLQSLDLSGTQVSNIEPLKGLQKLQRLYLRGTKVSKEQESALEKALPKLKIYH